MDPATAQKLLRKTQAEAAQALFRAKSNAYAAGEKLARAVKAGADLREQTQAALLARDAYWQRITAEGEKYRATYLLLAANERQTAASAAVAARGAKSERDQKHATERAQAYAKRAEILEQAASRAAAAVKDVQEPEVVSLRRAQRLATQLDQNLKADNLAPKVAARMSPLLNSKLYNPLVDWMYTENIKKAAGGIAGVGDAGVTPGDGTTGGQSWWDALKHALAVGVSDAGKSATKAGQEAAKDNPGTAIVAGSAGSVLAAVAAALGVQFNAGMQSGQNQTLSGEGGFPWGAVAAVAAVGVVGYVLLK